tara:strand:+ start:142 stop:378 length:237 start_codon:yes stop_codon:yes gene_type:complete
MFGGNPMAAMAVADVASQNPQVVGIVIIILLSVGCCVMSLFWTGPCIIICTCCIFICKSFFGSTEDFTVGSQKQKEGN